MSEANPEFDELADEYHRLLHDPVRERFAPGGRFFALRKWRLVERYYQRTGRDLKGAAWLDVGCGFGELLGVGRGSVRRAAGCDRSPEMLRRCGDMDVSVQPTAGALPYLDKSFDLVTAVCVFHHVEPSVRHKLVGEMSRVLAPRGVLCIIEHNPLNPVTQLIVRRTPVDANARLLTAGAVRRLVRAERFASVLTQYFLVFPEKLYGRAAEVEARLSGVPIGGQYAVFGSKPD